MSFVATDKAFQIDGKDTFLLSGEVHYFRVPRRLWGTHLRKLKAAQCHAVTTYIPWGWHEAQEGKFDFNGKTHPQRDLVGFFREAEKAGLYLIVKPGPYILAEFVAQGLPEWLISKHPEIICRDAEGNIIEEAMLTYLHPTFLSYTAKWYDKIMPLISQNLLANGGRIVMMQVCNEVGLNQWLCGKGDCNPISIEYFHRFLKETYGHIKSLNKILGRSYDNFKQVKPPTGTAQSREAYVIYRLWHRYHRWYYAIYVDHIIRETRARGVDCPLYHNVPGWVYGRANHFPQNITVYDEVVKKNPDLILAVDHIPENPGYRNFHDDLPCNDLVRSLRRGKGPLFAAELQAGSREFCVRTYPEELDLFYKACLANGLQGMNFYMFSQGRNPLAKGHFGPTFYWETALSTDGKELPLYPKIASLGRWLKSHGELLLSTSRRSQVAAGVYMPLYQTEFTQPLWGNHRVDFGKIGMEYDPKAIRDTVLFDGFLKASQFLNIDMDSVDLQTQSVEQLLAYKQLWVACGEWMDAQTQGKLEQYVRRGGHLIIAPNVPWLDENLLPCTILEDALKLKRDVLKTYSCPKISLLGEEDLYAFAKIQTFRNARKTLAKTMDGKSCGVQISLGKGKASVLGTALPNVISEHFDAYRRLFELDGVRPHAWCDIPDIRVVQRFGKGYSYLFVLNYHKNDFRGSIHYTDPVSGRVKKLPTKAAMRIGACSASIYPLNLPLSKGKTGHAQIYTKTCK